MCVCVGWGGGVEWVEGLGKASLSKSLSILTVPFILVRSKEKYLFTNPHFSGA